MNKLLRDVPPHPGMDVQLGLLLSALDEGTKEWRSELEELGEVPQQAIMWQPFSNAHSIGAVILHIIEVEQFWIHEVATTEAMTEEQFKVLRDNLTDVDGVNWPVPPDKPMAWYWDQLDQVRAHSRDIVKNLPKPQTLRTLPNIDREYSLRWILSHVIAHEAYHGGQAVFLRVMHEKMAST